MNTQEITKTANKSTNYNLTNWQRIRLPFISLYWSSIDPKDRKTWHEVKKSMEPHTHVYTKQFKKGPVTFAMCEHEGCTLCDIVSDDYFDSLNNQNYTTIEDVRRMAKYWEERKVLSNTIGFKSYSNLELFTLLDKVYPISPNELLKLVDYINKFCKTYRDYDALSLARIIIHDSIENGVDVLDQFKKFVKNH